MCGIVGYSGVRSKEKRNEFIRLIDESCIRGVHAFGIAYIQEGKLIVVKDTELQRVLVAIPDPLPEKIIFHNRYSTSGDYRDMRNNQPIHIGEEALVFNGTIDMGTKSEMQQRYGFTMQTDNDGEIILRDISIGRVFEHLEPKRSFSGIYLNAQGRMFALTNGMRPLWCFDTQGGKFITSTYDIARRAAIDTKNAIAVPPYTILPL